MVASTVAGLRCRKAGNSPATPAPTPAGCRHPDRVRGAAVEPPAWTLEGEALSGHIGRGGRERPAWLRLWRGHHTGARGSPCHSLPQVGSDRGGQASPPRRIGHGPGCQLRMRDGSIREWHGTRGALPRIACATLRQHPLGRSPDRFRPDGNPFALSVMTGAPNTARPRGGGQTSPKRQARPQGHGTGKP